MTKVWRNTTALMQSKQLGWSSTNSTISKSFSSLRHNITTVHSVPRLKSFLLCSVSYQGEIVGHAKLNVEAHEETRQHEIWVIRLQRLVDCRRVRVPEVNGVCAKAPEYSTKERSVVTSV